MGESRQEGERDLALRPVCGFRAPSPPATLAAPCRLVAPPAEPLARRQAGGRSACRNRDRPFDVILKPHPRRPRGQAERRPDNKPRSRRSAMQVMVFVKATKDSEAGKMPGKELLTAMGKFNEELVKAGVMLGGGGLRPSSKAARVRISDAGRQVIDGPFAETKELVAGYWLWQVRDLDEAIAWVKKCPHPHPGTDTVLEIRPLFEASDFEG